MLITEDQISRIWLSKKIFQSGLGIIRKRWHLYLATILLFIILVHFFGVQIKAWQLIFFIPSFPMIIAFSYIVVSPFFAMPQRWILTQRYIKARGPRLLGSISWSSVYDWRIEHISGLPHYYRLCFKWKKWGGVACGEQSILVPSSVPIIKVEYFFKKYSNRYQLAQGNTATNATFLGHRVKDLDVKKSKIRKYTSSEVQKYYSIWLKLFFVGCFLNSIVLFFNHTNFVYIKDSMLAPAIHLVIVVILMGIYDLYYRHSKSGKTEIDIYIKENYPSIWKSLHPFGDSSWNGFTESRFLRGKYDDGRDERLNQKRFSYETNNKLRMRTFLLVPVVWLINLLAISLPAFINHL